MAERFVLALDQGTTSSRAMVFDRDSRVRGMAQQEFRQIFPAPGQVEHDAAQIWLTQLAVGREALVQAGIEADQVDAVGITNQRETTVLWDRESGDPLHHAIVWQDRRTADHCRELREGPHGALIQARTGLQIDPYFSGTKLAWLLDNVPGARARAEAGELAFGTIDSWLLWRLTGEHATDASNASRTQLFNIDAGTWDDELLEIFGVPRQVLPEVRASSEIYAHTTADLFGAEIPVAGIAGDQQAALFGQMCVRPGMAKNTYGTGCFLLANTGTERVRSEARLLTTVAWRLGDELTYALEGSVFVGGAAVQWLRDELGIIESADEVEALARDVDSTEGVYFVPAFTGLGAPYWDPHARGALVGLTRGTTKAHLARATLDGVAQQVADVIEAMQSDRGEAITELRVDGGAAANDLLLQMQADYLGADVVRPGYLETTALGAAYLAGLATGFWSDLADLEARWSADARFHPSVERDAIAARRARWREAVAGVRALGVPRV